MEVFNAGNSLVLIVEFRSKKQRRRRQENLLHEKTVVQKCSTICIEKSTWLKCVPITKIY